MSILSGLALYGYMEIGILKSMEVTHSPIWREVLIVSSISNLNFATLRNLFRLLRSSIGLQWLLRFGTKISRL